MNADDQDNDSTPRKDYATPDLVEHGDIHTLVHRHFINGADGGFPVDNDS
jgi:hypothetical protein